MKMSASMVVDGPLLFVVVDDHVSLPPIKDDAEIHRYRIGLFWLFSRSASFADPSEHRLAFCPLPWARPCPGKFFFGEMDEFESPPHLPNE